MELSPDKPPIIEDIVTWITTPNEPEYVLRGSAGFGKSTLIAHVLKDMKGSLARLQKELYGSEEYTPVFTATTNKAASVLSEMLNEDVSTIHRLLGLRVKADYKTGKEHLITTARTVDQDGLLLIIDEAFKIDDSLLEIIRKHCKRSKVLFVGCPDQIAPVGYTESPIASIEDNVSELTISNRFGSESAIAIASNHYKDIVRSKSFSPLPSLNSSVSHITGNEFQDLLHKYYVETKQDPSKVKILTWTNDKSIAYSNHIRKSLTGSSIPVEQEQLIANSAIIDPKTEKVKIKADKILTIDWVSGKDAVGGIEGHFVNFRETAYQVFIPNNFNEVKEAMKVSAKEKDWPTYFKLKGQFADIRPVYSCTVDKSQGSTYETVFIDMANIGKCRQAHYVARMLHVAISRATKQVYLYGELPKKYRG